jgi:hypothetical protein
MIGEAPSVTVTTDDNLIAHVETRVDNGKLKIEPHGWINPRTGLTIDVTVPDLVAAGISGTGDLNIADVVGEELDLSISGAGSLTASGCVHQLSTSISGAGDADLKNLYAEKASVKISGAGDACVYASESIEARISGAGDVVCYGNPAHIDQKISGVGGLEISREPPAIEYTIADAPQWSK